jgi:uncharacterized protein (TIGR00369 family)
MTELMTSRPTVAPREEPAGLQALRARLSGGVPVGVAELLGMEVEAIETGRVVFACEAQDRFANPMGTVHGGIAATLLDSALGCAAQTVLPDGSTYSTVSLEVKYLRPIAVDAGMLRAEGRVVHAGRRQVTGEGTLTDDAGRVLATATTTCLVLPLP